MSEPQDDENAVTFDPERERALAKNFLETTSFTKRVGTDGKLPTYPGLDDED